MYMQLDYIMNKSGIDKLTLMSYIGHMGYSYGDTDILKDPYVELRAKMISFREMAESVGLLPYQPVQS
jgi:hypothetical protein